ncbi:MAG: DUF1592 domain-containing protein [Myxococcales bacterium]|nr:DUF1592 domain-containing protein [Myxococcales bacterium]
MIAAALLVSGCTGLIETPSGAGPAEPPSGRGRVRSCDETQVDLTPIRLLTRDEYNNTIRDLLGDNSRPLVDSPSADTGTFDNNANALSISSPMATHYLEAAEQVAAKAMQNPGNLLPCSPEGDGTACAKEFIATFGRRAFRRPVPDDEATALLALYSSVRTVGSFNDAIEVLIQAILNSPRFLYHIEVGSSVGNGVAALDDYELASKLSYFLWNTMPDEELAGAADRGEVHTPEQIEAQARRMLDSELARVTTANMHSQWLGLPTVFAVTKDLTKYREFTDEVRGDLVQETTAFLDEVVWNDEGSVKDIFTAPFSMMNARLADFYGVKGVTGDAFVRADVDTTQRLGLLGQGSLMAALSKIDRTSPVHRAVFVRHQILCEALPPAPDKVPALDVIDPTLPVRERMEEHRKNPECAGCHKLMDPLGFTFEHFDAVGRYREADELGNWVDSSGEWVDAIDGSTQSFDDAVGLSKAFGDSPQVARCMSEQWFSYSMGRTADEYDDCSLDRLEDVAETGSIKDVLLAIATQEQFRFRAEVEATGGCQ